MNQNPLDAERRSLNNASGRKHAPDKTSKPVLPKFGNNEIIDQAKRNSQDGQPLE